MANSAIPGLIFAGGGGGTELEANQFKTLRFTSAPAVMEFGFTIGDGTDPVVLNGGMDAAAIKAAIEASDDTDGFTADVYGSTTTSTGPDGVLLHSGMFIVAMRGEAPFPTWSAVLNSEVQAFVVEEGDASNYTLNGGANFQMGVSASTLQSNQRALSGDYNNVLVKGSSATPGITLQVNTTTNNVPFSGTNAPTSATNGQPGDASYEIRQSNIVNFYHNPGVGESLGGWFINYDTGPLNGNEWHVTVPSGAAGEYEIRIKAIIGGTPTYFSQVFDVSSEPSVISGSYTAVMRSYFPFGAGDVTSPAATGTDATVSTIYQGGSTSSVITANSSTMEEVLISGLELPASTAPTGAYTPANAGHWNTPPTTTTEALNMLAAAFNSVWGPV